MSRSNYIYDPQRGAFLFHDLVPGTSVDIYDGAVLVHTGTVDKRGMYEYVPPHSVEFDLWTCGSERRP